MFDGDLSRRVALVTGGRRGIGAAIAQRLAAAGAAVVIAAQSADDSGLAETVDLIRRRGGRAAPLVFDLASPEARANAVAACKEIFGPVDVLVNNAAINNYAPPSAMDLAYRRMMLEVNLHGPVDLIQQALPHMKAQGWGRILGISSASTQQPAMPYAGPAQYVHGGVVYGASKAALNRFTTGLAAELHGTGVTINATFPTAVCLTGENSQAAKAALRKAPEMAEGGEMMAEAAMLLITGGMTGVVMPSRAIVAMLQAPLHSLDGCEVVGDANTLPALD